MKTLPTSSIVLLFLGATIALSVVVAQSAPAGKSSTAAATNTTEEIPKSVFTIPNAGGVARDPFFPTRIIQGEVATAVQPTNSHPSSLGCLTLKGLSGAPSSPLAMINGRTMARGEDAEINTDCGRLLVHCVDITTNSAIIEVGGERRELRLRSEF
jgi:hypothetical protein